MAELIGLLGIVVLTGFILAAGLTVLIGIVILFWPFLLGGLAHQVGFGDGAFLLGTLAQVIWFAVLAAES